jgi:urea transport system substrate-binding protein
MLEAVARKAGSLDVAKMDAASEGASYSGPRGVVTMRSRHVEQDVYVADVDAKGFRVIKTFPRVPSGQSCKV